MMLIKLPILLIYYRQTKNYIVVTISALSEGEAGDVRLRGGLRRVCTDALTFDVQMHCEFAKPWPVLIIKKITYILLWTSDLVPIILILFGAGAAMIGMFSKGFRTGRCDDFNGKASQRRFDPAEVERLMTRLLDVEALWMQSWD